MIQFMGSNKYIIRKIKCWPVFKQDPRLAVKTHVTSIPSFCTSTDGGPGEDVARSELSSERVLTRGVVPQGHADLLQHHAMLRGCTSEWGN